MVRLIGSMNVHRLPDEFPTMRAHGALAHVRRSLFSLRINNSLAHVSNLSKVLAASETNALLRV